MTEYAILSLLLYLAIKNSFAKPKYGYVCLLTIILSILYGITDEFHQSFVPWRRADKFDILADATGAITTQVIIYIKNRFSSLPLR